MHHFTIHFLSSAVLCLLVFAAPLQAQRPPDPLHPVSLIAFGSCAHENKSQPILERAAEAEPDLFIYLGDNIYGDTHDMDKLRKKYGKLKEKAEFHMLCGSTPILATWDDHDYGENDAGRHYPMKSESREIFLDFWNEPAESERRKHPGVYHARLLGSVDRRVQVILLDTRSFRDDLLHAKGKPWKNDYRPNPSPDSTFLGAEQWAWLETQLKKPAKVRIIASSNQFSHAYNGWESWRNVPREQEKMENLIRECHAEGVIFISGDVHWGELSRYEPQNLYPLYDLTSSGITQTWRNVEENQNRIGAPVRENNFGMIEIEWEKKDPKINFYLQDREGKTVLNRSVRLSELGWEK